MLETHMTDRREPVSVLPEALRRAVLDCTDTRADAPRQSVAEAWRTVPEQPLGRLVFF